MRIKHTRVYAHEVDQGGPVIDYSYYVDVDAHSGKVIGFQGDFFRRKVDSISGKSGMSVKKSTQEYLKNHPATLVYIWPIGNKAPELVYMPLNSQILVSLKG